MSPSASSSPSMAQSCFSFSRLSSAPVLLQLLLLSLLLLLLPVANASRNHHHGHHQKSQTVAPSGNDNEIPASELSSSETSTESPAPEAQTEGNIAAVAGTEQRRTTNLFQEYLGRGMLTCTQKYVGIIAELNKLIVSAHAEFTSCQRMAEQADRNGQSAEKSRKLAAQLEMINELFNE